MLTSTVLCIFEGQKREHDYFSSLQRALLNDVDVIKCSYGNDIFELYDEIKDDDDLNIVDVIRDSKSCPENKVLLEGFSSDDINQVYLFFDMECHDDKYLAKKLFSMLNRFSQEDDTGKLFISYPMLEALRDIPSIDSFIKVMIDAKDCSGKVYKKLSADRGMNKYSQIKKLTASDWRSLIKINVEKANYIVNYNIHCDHCCEQVEILSSQVKKLEEIDSIYVLSAFPLFAYYHIPKDTLSLKCNEHDH